MKIDRIEPMIRQEHTFRVLLSDGSVIKTQDYVIADLGLYSGMELDEAGLKALKTAVGKASAKVRAVRIVSASGVSKRELERRLTQKGETPQDAREAVQWLSDLDLLDDSRVAEQVVARCISRGYGLTRAKQALYEKKVPKKYWEDALVDYPDQAEKIEDFLRSRLDGESDSKEIKKCVDALMRRGHSYAVIRRALNQLRLETEEFPEE